MKALVLHQERCTGCSLCEIVCGLAHFKENNPKKAAIHIERKFPEPGTFEIRVCNQCGRCREVCPSEAISEKDGVYQKSEKVWNLTRAYWVREVKDFGRKCDLPPERVYDPLPSGSAKGMHLMPGGVNRMLDEYYALRGWNKDGIPREEKLKELGLGGVAEDLKRPGKMK